MNPPVSKSEIFQKISRNIYVQISAILALFLVLREFVNGIKKLDEAVYMHEIILWEALKTPFVAVLFALGLLLFITGRDIAWKKLEMGKSLRWLIGTVVIILCWKFLTYGYNFYFDQPHVWDRILIIILAAASLCNPRFVYWFMLVAVLVTAQFHHPLGTFSWTDKRVLYEVLMIFSCFLFLKGINRRTSVYALLFVVFTFQASQYFIAGAAKLKLDGQLLTWIQYEHLEYLFVGSHLYGWLSFLSEETVLKAAEVLKFLRWPMILGTLAIECLALFVFFNRRVFIGVFAAACVLHLLIFITSGICFWKWVALNIAFIFFVSRLTQEQCRILFSRGLFVFSLLVILTSTKTYNPVRLGWLDGNLYNIYRLELIGESGTVYHVHPNFMKPYDLRFAQNRFSFLNPGTVYMHTYGSLQESKLLKLINEYGRKNRIDELKRIHPRVKFHQDRARVFDDFVRKYFRNLDRERYKAFPFTFLPAPMHIYTHRPAQNFYDFQEPIVSVRVRHIEKFYSGEDIRETENRIIRRIPLKKGSDGQESI